MKPLLKIHPSKSLTLQYVPTASIQSKVVSDVQQKIKVVEPQLLTSTEKLHLEQFKKELKIKKHQKIIKTVTDKIIATTGLILSSPIMLGEAIAIKLESKGPILFKQTRFGKDAKPFTIYKFRTLACTTQQESGRVKSLNDNRITKVGAILRKYSLDEIPQLINVIKGDMTLVGPRPTSYAYTKESGIGEYYLKYAAKPGCFFNYEGRGDDIPKRMQLEREYIENQGLLQDFRIIINGIKKVITGSNY